MLMRCRFTKEGLISYISHLDLMDVWRRALKRSAVPVAYSEGFNPHPKMNLAGALSVGVESLWEYMEVELTREIPPEQFLSKLNAVLPQGIQVLECQVPQKKNEMSQRITHSFYRIYLEAAKEIVPELQTSLERILGENEILEEKKSKKGAQRTIDLRRQIWSLRLQEEDSVILEATLQTSIQGSLKPWKLLEIISSYANKPLEANRVVKTKVFQMEENQLIELN